MSTEQQNITFTDSDINEFLPLVPGDVVEDNAPGSNFLNPKSNVSTSFLDSTDEEEIEEGTDPTEDINDIINDAPADDKTTTEKASIVKTFNKLFEKGLLTPFEDDKAIEEYSTNDFIELLEANRENDRSSLEESVRTEFFDALPEELQYAAKYVADGGQDLKGLLKALSQTQEVRELDVKKDAEEIYRNYLHLTTRFTPERVEKEIKRLKDLNELEAEAASVKPELDSRAQEVIANRIKEQEKQKELRVEAAKKYTDNVYEALKAGELNGVKLTKGTQTKLFSELTQPKYDSISGRKTNLLGHLLEKYQFVEPNLGLVAEALWLLSDPEKYKEEIMKNATSIATTKTVRQLKTAQDNMASSGQELNDKSKVTTQSRSGIKRDKRNIFER